MPTIERSAGMMTENKHYWAEYAAEQENERRLSAVAGIPVEALERYARFYWAAQHVDFNVSGGSDHVE